MTPRPLTLTLALAALALTATVALAAPATPAAKAPAAKPRPAAPPSAAPAGGRTLDAIHIEGEVAVPQVLFITARDQRRFMDSQHRRYLRTSRQLAAVPPPARIRFTPPPTTRSPKEESR